MVLTFILEDDLRNKIQTGAGVEKESWDVREARQQSYTQSTGCHMGQRYLSYL